MSDRSLLEKLGFESFNPMQEAVREASAKHDNLVVYSSTGSGKTVAFLLPLLANLNESKEKVQAVILTPSRELAIQIEKVFRQMATSHKVLCCYGGHSIEVERLSLQHPPALLVGTPGRIDDHIRRGHLDLSSATTIVLDEFDKSLELGFQKEMSRILFRAPNLEKRILTSATRMKEIPDYTKMEEHEEIDFINDTKPDTIKMLELRAEGNDKLATLIDLVKTVGNENTIVFCNHRDAVDRISELLFDEGVVHERFHGGMEQSDREGALLKFRNQSTRILVTTDLAARGLDIPSIRTVVHYQIPTTLENFTHRNGRTGRMGADGQSIMLLKEEDKYPKFLKTTYDTFVIPTEIPEPKLPEYSTLYIGAGKKDKVNKIDVVGLLCQKGGLKKEEIGQIEVMDRAIFVGIKRDKMSKVISALRNEKIKRKKVKIAKAK